MRRISTPRPPSVIVRMTQRQVSHKQWDKSSSVSEIRKQTTQLKQQPGPTAAAWHVRCRVFVMFPGSLRALKCNGSLCNSHNMRLWTQTTTVTYLLIVSVFRALLTYFWKSRHKMFS